MKIQVTMIKENEDGSANVRLDTDEEGTKFLLAYGFEHALREGLKNMTVKPLDDEDEVWKEIDRMNDIQTRNKASMAAWNAAGMFVTENADKLSRLSLRQAFEEGFMQGYKFAKEK